MFESLTDTFEGIFSRLRNKGVLTEADVDEVLREIRVALLEADVNLTVVKSLRSRIKERAVGEEVHKALNPAQQVVQDYELNIRLRKAGGEVWFDPGLTVGYRPRGSWSALALQYYEYGSWKAEVIRMHPDSLRARQAIPPLAVGAAVIGLVVGVRRRSALLAPASYVAVLASTARPGSRLTTPAALGVMHTSWAAGLLAATITQSRRRDCA